MIITIIDPGTSHSLWAGALESSVEERDSFVLLKEADCRASGVNGIIAGIQLFISLSIYQLFMEHLLSTRPWGYNDEQKALLELTFWWERQEIKT